MADFAVRRQQMVDEQIARRGVHNADVLNAMREVPRERFVGAGMEYLAYQDAPLPIGEKQTISQPYIVAAMIEAAQILPVDRVLEVGAGSGYAAAVIGRIAAQVFTIERHETLACLAEARMRSLGYDNVDVRCGDGTTGLAEEAPFDAILVAASGPSVPQALMDQLTIGGRLVVPIGGAGTQQLCKVTRLDQTRFEQEYIGAVAFVPLIGEHGWHDAPTLWPG